MSTEWQKLLAVMFVVLVFWMTALSALALQSRPSDQVVVWAPPTRLEALLSASPVSVVQASSTGFVVLRGASPGFVSELYAHGAWLVLPARQAGGCVSGRRFS